MCEINSEYGHGGSQYQASGMDPAPPTGEAGMMSTELQAREPATASEAWAAVQGVSAGLLTRGEAHSVIASYLAPGPQPRYDTPRARAEALADREAGS
jgi:hypothetical protein